MASGCRSWRRPGRWTFAAVSEEDQKTVRWTVLPTNAHGAYTHLARPGRKGGKPLALAIVLEPMAHNGSFYQSEAALRGKAPDLRRAIRQEQSRPLVDDVFTWLAAQAGRVSRKSDLGMALAHMLRRQDGFGVSRAYAAPRGPRSPSTPRRLPRRQEHPPHRERPPQPGHAPPQCPLTRP